MTKKMINMWEGERNMMKAKILKELHQILIQIAKADDSELNKIGVKLAEIEKELLTYTSTSKKQYKKLEVRQ